jgi:hypothetical protein
MHDAASWKECGFQDGRLFFQHCYDFITLFTSAFSRLTLVVFWTAVHFVITALCVSYGATSIGSRFKQAASRIVATLTLVVGADNILRLFDDGWLLLQHCYDLITLYATPSLTFIAIWTAVHFVITALCVSYRATSIGS